MPSTFPHVRLHVSTCLPTSFAGTARQTQLHTGISPCVSPLQALASPDRTGHGGGTGRKVREVNRAERSAKILACLLATGAFVDATPPRIDGIIPDTSIGVDNCPALAAMLKLVPVEDKYSNCRVGESHSFVFTAELFVFPRDDLSYISDLLFQCSQQELRKRASDECYESRLKYYREVSENQSEREPLLFLRSRSSTSLRIMGVFALDAFFGRGKPGCLSR